MSSKTRKKQEEITVEQKIEQEKQEQLEEVTVEQEKSEQQESLIYVGPSLPGGLLTKYRTFSNGIPDHLKAHFEKCPAFKQLFVPVNQFAEVESRLKDVTSAESVFYRKTVQYFARKG